MPSLPRNLFWPTYRLAPLPSSPIADLAVALKSVYRVRNWPDYDAGLQQRGSLTVWFTSPSGRSVVLSRAAPTGGAIYLFGGRHPNGVDLRLLYHLPLRQTEGFVASILALMGLAVRVPDHTTLSRRQAGLTGIGRPAQG